ncbi:MAG TPA: hypothetical protein VFA86_11375 [Gammaproteobacteria bacterium]|nr:hypothetical protein [Gammaproteobacteria bacterium]
MRIVKAPVRRWTVRALELAGPLTGALLLFLMLSGLAEASVPPPGLGYSSATQGPESATAPVRYVAFGAVPVVLEQSTLDEVRRAAGRGQIEHKANPDGTEHWLCYTLAKERVWVVSDGTAGGPDHRVTEVSADRIEDVRPVDGCPELPDSLQPVSVNGEVWIGTAEDTARAILGQPASQYGWWQAFEHRSQLPGSCEPAGYDRLNWLMLEMEKGRVVAVRAGQVTSC